MFELVNEHLQRAGPSWPLSSRQLNNREFPLVVLKRKTVLSDGLILSYMHFYKRKERETGIEPATFSLARRRSTTLLLAHNTGIIYHVYSFVKYFFT